MSTRDGKSPKTMIGETAKEMTGDGRKTNYPKHIQDKYGKKKSKK